MPNNMLVAFVLLLSSFPPHGFSDEYKGENNLLPVRVRLRHYRVFYYNIVAAQ